MLKKTITYKDLDGNDITEDFYFSLSKAEIAETELSYEGGLTAHLRRIVETKNGAEIIGTFKKILTMSVGRRSEDGKRFIKSDEITQEFMQTDAYSELFMELVTDAEASAAFVRGIVPADLSEKMPANVDLSVQYATPPAEEPEDKRPAFLKENREPTKQELLTLSREDLVTAMQQRVLKNQSR